MSSRCPLRGVVSAAAPPLRPHLQQIQGRAPAAVLQLLRQLPQGPAALRQLPLALPQSLQRGALLLLQPPQLQLLLQGQEAAVLLELQPEALSLRFHFLLQKEVTSITRAGPAPAAAFLRQ